MGSIKYLSLFTGIGGFEVGIEKAGVDWECVGFSEIKPHSIQVYENHFPDHKNWGDIAKIDPKDIPATDIIVGGFPCQPYSIASNKRQGLDDKRGRLFFDILRLIDEHSPKVVFLENVKGMVNHNGGRTRWLIEQHIRERGYKVYSQVLNSSNFGVPHNRSRLYFVAIRSDISHEPFQFPKGSSSDGNFQSILEESPPDSVYLTPQQIFKMNGFGTSNSFGGYLSNSKIYNCITASYCVDGGNSMKFWRNGKISALSPVECERLQGFPDNWTDGIGARKRYETLGNAVTTNTISSIVLEVQKQIL